MIVETGNYMPHRDPRIDAIEDGMVESVWVQQQLGRPVIKAFNSIMAESLQNQDTPAGTPGASRFLLRATTPGKADRHGSC